MMSLLRLGVKKIFILDRDVVDIHNLNRQIMYTTEDVGKSKVQSATKNAKIHNLRNTQIVGFEGNALTNWQRIIEMAKQCNVIFNCIDHGEYFDVSVAALCLKLQIPLIMGGTYATSLTIDYFSGQGKPCYLCTDDAANKKEILNQIIPEKILQLQDLSFLPKNNNPISRSSIIVCTICGQLMISHYLNYICLSQENPYPSSRTICYHNTFEIMKFSLEAQKKCLFCGDPNYVEQKKQQKKQQEELKEDVETKINNCEQKPQPMHQQLQTQDKIQVAKQEQ